MAKVTDDLFDKAVNETSFAIPTEGKPKTERIVTWLTRLLKLLIMRLRKKT